MIHLEVSDYVYDGVIPVSVTACGEHVGIVEASTVWMHVDCYHCQRTDAYRKAGGEIGWYQIVTARCRGNPS